MLKEFKPDQIDIKNSQFNVWEFDRSEKETIHQVSKEEQVAIDVSRMMQEAQEKGYKVGMEQAQAEISRLKTEVGQWVELLQKPAKLLDDLLTQELIQTVMWLSQYCIGVELSIDPKQIRNLLNHIKDELPSLQGNKVFAMHPDDINWIKTHLHEREIIGLLEVLVPDTSLKRGDFYLKSEHGELDGRIETRFLTLCEQYINKDNLILPPKSQE